MSNLRSDSTHLAINLLTRLVSFDTTSCNANRALIDFVRDYLNQYGITSEIVASDDGDKACLWATVGTPDKNGIVLAGHTDTVPVTGQAWDSDPFTLTERDEKLFARGSADMKGFIACILAFVPEYLAANTGGCFHIALTYDEETGMGGAMRLTDYLLAQNAKPSFVWIGEPTGLTIVDQHKGVAAFNTYFTGVPAHSGYPDKGTNAITMAWEFMSVLADQARSKKEKPYQPSVFDPAYTTFNLGVIKGGAAQNIIAGKCDLTWELRIHPGDTSAEIRDEIEKRVRHILAPRFAAFAPQAGMEICVCCDIPPFVAQADNRGVKILKRALKCDETYAVGFATEAGIFQKLGAPAVVCGPGFIEQAHQPNEFVDKNQLEACVDLMRHVLLSSPAP